MGGNLPLQANRTKLESVGGETCARLPEWAGKGRDFSLQDYVFVEYTECVANMVQAWGSGLASSLRGQVWAILHGHTCCLSCLNSTSMCTEVEMSSDVADFVTS